MSIRISGFAPYHGELYFSDDIEQLMYGDRHICVIVPAYNEESSIGKVLEGLFGILDPLRGGPLVDQVIVCDNASTDETVTVASRYPCIIVKEPVLGYGAACQAALNYSCDKDIVVFVDADCSVEIAEMPCLLRAIVDGADLVVGARIPARRQSGALSFPQRFGNGLASFLIRLFWRQSVTDLGPFRAVRWEALQIIDMQDRKYGWTIEMQVRAIQEGLKVVEVPVSVLKRIGKSKISGTVSGVVGAGKGILGTLFKLLLREQYQWFLRRTGLRKSAW
ncbi:MAG: glycosyltransferase family 2 protein [bacterium]